MPPPTARRMAGLIQLLYQIIKENPEFTTGSVNLCLVNKRSMETGDMETRDMETWRQGHE